MNTKKVMVREDIYQSDIKVGDIIPLFFGTKVKILDVNYRNQYGEFILCEEISSKKIEGEDGKWQTVEGVKPHPDNPYEIIGTIHAPGYRNLLGGIGFYVKNRELNDVLGLSYNETWSFIFRDGATNAYATKSNYAQFFSRLIDTIDDLPSLDSHYWKIPAYDTEGELFADLSKNAKKELQKGMKHAVRNLANEKTPKASFKKNIDQHQIKILQDYIKQAEDIVVLTGAGVSTMSGIPDYRTAAFGMWRKNPSILECLNESTFQQDPQLFWTNFYQLLKTTLSDLMPFQNHESLLAAIDGIEGNSAHRLFAELEKMGKSISIITQNVDGLHQQAGSKHVIDFHGNIRKCFCPNCNENYSLTEVLEENQVPYCACQTALRPDVVFFGDAVKGAKEAEELVMNADLVIIAGHR